MTTHLEPAVDTAQLPPLPHWEETPEDLGTATAQVKKALRERIAASGRTVEEVFAVVEARIRAEVQAIAAEKARGESVWPIVDYADIEAGTVPAELVAKIRRRGCAVIRGHFPREQALAWDAGIVDYVESNRFFETYTGPGDDFFETVGSKPESTRSTGATPRWRPASTRGWRRRRRSSTRCGRTSRRGGRGSTRIATRCTPTASAAARRARRRAGSAPTSTPARSTCG